MRTETLIEAYMKDEELLRLLNVLESRTQMSTGEAWRTMCAVNLECTQRFLDHVASVVERSGYKHPSKNIAILILDGLLYDRLRKNFSLLEGGDFTPYISAIAEICKRIVVQLCNDSVFVECYTQFPSDTTLSIWYVDATRFKESSERLRQLYRG
jgi:hypothetical protein